MRERIHLDEMTYNLEDLVFMSSVHNEQYQDNTGHQRYGHNTSKHNSNDF